MGDRQLLGRCGLKNLYAHNTTAHNKLSCASSIVFSFFLIYAQIFLLACLESVYSLIWSAHQIGGNVDLQFRMG